VRRAIALLAAIGGGVLIAWIAASRALSGATLVTSWPSPAFAQQFPERDENASATRLLATVERFGDDLSTIRRGEVPPAFLEKHANTIRTLRAQIISNDAPVWALDVDDILEPPSPPFRTHLRLFALLGADALAQHARNNDAAAWADLHASWILARSLWQRPETMSIAVALSGSRIIAAAAPKIGPPLPAWWSEFASFDVRAPLLHAIEYEAYAMQLRAERYPLGEPDGSQFNDTVRRIAAPLVRPIRIAQSSVAIGGIREVALAVQHAKPCRAIAIPGMPEWSGFATRFNDFRCAVTK